MAERTWYTIYVTADGALVGGTAADPRPLTNPDWSVKIDTWDPDLGESRPDSGNMWDPATTSWVPRPVSRRITASRFVNLFKNGELMDICFNAAHNAEPNCLNFFYVQGTFERATTEDLRINLDGPKVIALIDGLGPGGGNAGILTNPRKAEILANQDPT